ncbi:MAG: ComEA family DNA-binding protein [Saprospiraceae bacterium]
MKESTNSWKAFQKCLLTYKHKILCFLLCLLWFNINAQIEEENTGNTENQIIIEDAIDQAGEEGDFNFDTQFENLTAYAKNPLNLNRANEDDLTAFGLLNPIQIQSLIQYRNDLGNLLSIYELQAIPNFDLNTINRILSYVSVGNELIGKEDFKGRLIGGENTIFTRFRRVLEEQEGYKTDADNAYLGNRNQYYFRYRYNYDTRLSYGITLEKDAGEEFFTGSNRQGFDYMSAHFYARDLSKNVKAIALGDFQASLGQGLTIWSGFGFGKSASVLNTKRQAIPIRAYTSVNENAFLRGIGTTLQFGEIKLTLFGSYRNLDANVSQVDTTNFEEEIQAVSAFQISGFHRNPNEIQDEKSLGQTLFGGSLSYNLKRGKITLNAVNTQYDAKIEVDDIPVNLYRFSGESLTNVSVDYDYTFRNIHFFGETAMSDNLGVATLNSVLISTGKNIDFTILHRHFQPEFQTIAGNVFAESGSVNNESGLYFGVQCYFNREWKASAYFDSWTHNWLKFNIEAPSTGSEYLVQLNYRPARYTEMYLRFRNEVKERNATVDSPIDYLVPNERTQLRFHLSSRINNSLTIKSRVEVSRFDNGIDDAELGFLVYQDLAYNFGNFKFSTRFALFDTESFNARIFAYESDLLFNFSVPAYYYQGSRFYLNCRYRVSRAVMLEARFARTTFYNRETVGTALEEIDGNKRSEIKLQARIRF